MQAKDARCWTRQSVTSFDAPPVLSPHGCPKLCEAASSGDGLERLSIIAAAVAVVVCEWSFADTSFETLGDDGAATGGADCFCPMLCDGVVGCVVSVRRSGCPVVVFESRVESKNLFVRKITRYPKVEMGISIEKGQVALREKEGHE